MSKLVALFLINGANEYQQFFKAEAERAVARLGMGLEVHAAEDDGTLQVQQIYECIRRGSNRPDAIVVFPVREGSLYRVGHDAARVGVGWVVLNRRGDYLQDLQRDFPSLPFAIVGPDQVEAGRVQGRQARALLGDRGLLLYVMGSAVNHAAQDRLSGLQDALRGSGIEISRVYGNWTTDKAEHAVGDWLRLVAPTGTRPALVVAQNDAMAVGATNILHRLAGEMAQPELAKVPVTGLDGCASGRALVDQGRLAATVIQPSSSSVAIEFLSKAFAGERQPMELVLPLRSYPEIDRLRHRSRASA